MKLSRRTCILAGAGLLAVLAVAVAFRTNRSGFDVKDPAYRFVGCTIAHQTGYTIGRPTFAKINNWLVQHGGKPLTADQNLNFTRLSGMHLSRLGAIDGDLHVRYLLPGPIRPLLLIRQEPGLKLELLIDGKPRHGFAVGDCVRSGVYDLFWTPFEVLDFHGAELRLYDPDDGHLVATCRLK